MTVSSKIKATVASMEGVLADFKELKAESSDVSTKNLYDSIIKQAEEVLKKLQGRVEFIEKEEPQYKEE